jgi:hypothetical protein
MMAVEKIVQRRIILGLPVQARTKKEASELKAAEKSRKVVHSPSSLTR